MKINIYHIIAILLLSNALTFGITNWVKNKQKANAIENQKQIGTIIQYLDNLDQFVAATFEKNTTLSAEIEAVGTELELLRNERAERSLRNERKYARHRSQKNRIDDQLKKLKKSKEYLLEKAKVFER